MHPLGNFFLSGIRLIAIICLTAIGYVTIRVAGEFGLAGALGYVIYASPEILLDVGALLAVWHIRRQLARKTGGNR